MSFLETQVACHHWQLLKFHSIHSHALPLPSDGTLPASDISICEASSFVAGTFTHQPQFQYFTFTIGTPICTNMKYQSHTNIYTNCRICPGLLYYDVHMFVLHYTSFFSLPRVLTSKQPSCRTRRCGGTLEGHHRCCLRHPRRCGLHGRPPKRNDLTRAPHGVQPRQRYRTENDRDGLKMTMMMLRHSMFEGQKINDKGTSVM